MEDKYKNNQILGKKIELLRNAKRITIKEMSKKLGFKNYQSYREYELGKKNLNLSILNQISDILDIQIGDLIDSRKEIKIENFFQIPAANSTQQSPLVATINPINNAAANDDQAIQDIVTNLRSINDSSLNNRLKIMTEELAKAYKLSSNAY